jgi:twitching motility protein PilT
MNILVVDDEPSVRRVAMRVLENAGHRCFPAGTSAEAVTLLGRNSFDVAMLDVRMPGESGLELARLIQRAYPKVRVVMVTATADFSSVAEARVAGAIDYLVKPVPSAALRAAVERAGARGKRPLAPAEPLSAPPAVLAPTAATPSAAPVASAEPMIDRLFHAMVEAGASDLHLAAHMPPMVRQDGDMCALETDAEPLTVPDIVRLLHQIMPSKNRQEFEATHDTDFAYEIPGLSRFRGNVFMDRKGMAAVFRTVPNAIVSAETLGLTPAMLQLCQLRKGLVLVTGPTGSGKSTTLAAMIDHINRHRSDHVITIEDPIEFVHENERCLVNQREVYSHTASFKTALRAALREDPDVLLIGEMRDLETVAIALEAAETGHLVFATLHTSTAASTIDRVIDQFPGDRQAQIRVMLSESLKGVIAQTLCRQVGGGRVAAWEVLIMTPAISNLIRTGKTFQIPSMMQVGRSAGMAMLNDSLFELVRASRITAEEADSRAIDKAGLAVMLGRGGTERENLAPTAGQGLAKVGVAV